MNERLQDVLRMLPEAQKRTAEIQSDFIAKQDEINAHRHRMANIKWRNRNKGTTYAQAKRSAKVRADRLVNGIEFFQAEDEAREIKRTTRRCSYCNCPLEPKNVIIDHKIPLSKGGKHERGNLVGACHHCNSSKGSQLNWKPRPHHMYVEKVD